MALPMILNIYNKLIKIDSAPGFFFINLAYTSNVFSTCVNTVGSYDKVLDCL